MTLIHQGKFRERANRTSRYQQSENKQTQLSDRKYNANSESKHHQANNKQSTTATTA